MNIQVFKDLGIAETRFEAGSAIIREGEPTREVYVLVFGKVAVTTRGVQVASVDSIGTIFGEISALLGTLPVATVTTVEPSSFYVVPEFVEFIRANPEACISVAQILACRLVNMNNHFVQIKDQLEELRTNLAHYLPVFPENFQPHAPQKAPARTRAKAS